MMSRKASQNVQHIKRWIKPWSGWATIAEDHNGLRSSHRRTEDLGYSELKLIETGMQCMLFFQSVSVWFYALSSCLLIA